MFARVSPERAPIANFTLLVTNMLTALVVTQQWIIATDALREQATGQLWVLLGFALVLGVLGVFAARTKLAMSEQQARIFSGVALVWILVGLASLSGTASLTEQPVTWVLFALLAFALTVFHTTKRNHISEVLVSLAFGTLFAVSAGTWTVTLYPSTHLLNPIAFIGLSVVAVLVLRRFSKVEGAVFTYAAIGSYLVSWAAYAFQRFTEIQAADALSNSLWATVVSVELRRERVLCYIPAHCWSRLARRRAPSRSWSFGRTPVALAHRSGACSLDRGALLDRSFTQEPRLVRRNLRTCTFNGHVAASGDSWTIV
jgi:hypothetical protein